MATAKGSHCVNDDTVTPRTGAAYACWHGFVPGSMPNASLDSLILSLLWVEWCPPKKDMWKSNPQQLRM